MENKKENALIFQKIPAIMQDITAIGKDRQNKAQGYNFRGIDDMYNELHTHFATHGVFYTSDVISETREERATKSGGNMIYTILKVRFTFFAEDGSNVSSTTIGEGSDSGDKSSNKAMSTALKYALMQLLLIPTEEEKDTEYNSPEFAPKAPPKKAENKTPQSNFVSEKEIESLKKWISESPLSSEKKEKAMAWAKEGLTQNQIDKFKESVQSQLTQ